MVDNLRLVHSGAFLPQETCFVPLTSRFLSIEAGLFFRLTMQLLKFHHNYNDHVFHSFIISTRKRKKGQDWSNCNWASRRPIRAVLISSLPSMKRLGVFLLSLSGILAHRWLPPSILSGFPQAICWFPFIHLGGERYCES